MKQTSHSFRIVVSLVALALCLSASSAATAADKPKPPYDLGELPDGLEVAWPKAPKIERETTVDTLDEFNKAAATAGTRVVVEAAIPRIGTISASDVEVQMSDDGSLGGVTIARSVKRVALIGGQYNGTVEISYPSTFSPSRVDNPDWMVEDVMIDGVSVESNTTAFFLRGKRVALLRSHAHSTDYAIFSDTARGMQNEDVIVADNDLVSEGRQATVRLISARTSVTVDNHITSLMQAMKHNYRVHGQTGQSYAARNVLVNSGVMLSTMPGDQAEEIWFDDNTMHHKTPDLFNPDQEAIHILHARNNVAYTDVWKCFYCGHAPTAWDLDNNVVHPYE